MRQLLFENGKPALKFYGKIFHLEPFLTNLKEMEFYHVLLKQGMNLSFCLHDRYRGGVDSEGRPVMVIVGAHFLLRCLELERFVLYVVKVVMLRLKTRRRLNVAVNAKLDF